MRNKLRSTPVVLASTVMLSFISFWRAAAIVLNDLGSTAYYVGGISEQAVGKSAPWFILGIRLFSYKEFDQPPRPLGPPLLSRRGDWRAPFEKGHYRLV